MIYFDHNATTPVLPEVRAVVEEAMESYWGNPSSIHCCGRKAFAELERARERVAGLINASADEIYFTSGGTESDNLALFGIMNLHSDKEMVYSAIEHPAVMAPALHLQSLGRKCHAIEVDNSGIINTTVLSEKINKNTCLVSVMAANNEIGTLQPIDEIGEIVSAGANAVFHCDAVQALGKIPLDVKRSKIDLLSLSSHKVNGPKGVGVLYVRRGIKIDPIFFGGHQERNIRPGTQNLPAVLGFVTAAEICCNRMKENSEKLFSLTEYMYSRIVAEINEVIRNGDSGRRIPGTINLSFSGVETQVLVAALDQEGICISGGSACQSGSVDPSAVVLALGRRYQEAACAVRFSLGFSNTKEEVDDCIDSLKNVVERIRGHN
ncbi:Cysteine desulfurase [Chitinispirillum alkaliphilum]|nr:Cysteine desulfurase [Chitinispirillum alkaliphilum]